MYAGTAPDLSRNTNKAVDIWMGSSGSFRSSLGESCSSGSKYSGKGYSGSLGLGEIDQMISKSHTFGFCLYKKNLTLARHIGILVHLNSKKAFLWTGAMVHWLSSISLQVGLIFNSVDQIFK